MRIPEISRKDFMAVKYELSGKVSSNFADSFGG